MQKTRPPKTITSAVASFALGFLAIACFAQPAQATTPYDRAGAVAYAKNYACNPNVNCANGNYMRIGGLTVTASMDCTNFVSQALFEGGGLPKITSGSTLIQWYYSDIFKMDFTGSTNWINVGGLYNQLALTGRIASTASPSKTAAYSGANPGDLYMYDWGLGEGYSHLAMATSDGTFVNYYDNGYSKNYNSVTGGAGSKLAQHSTDRDGAPWNWGYWVETRTSVRQLMKTRLIHIASYAP